MSAGRWVLLATVLAVSMPFLDATALNVALPALQEDLHADAADLFWVVNAYALCLTPLLLVGGALGDRYGRRAVLMLGVALFAAASLACGLAPTTELLIVSRAAQGVGAALLLPGSLALLAASSPIHERGKVIGTWSALTVVATAAGPVLGGVCARAGLWRGVFFLNLPLAALALVVLGRRVPESRPDGAPPLDAAAAVAATLGLFGVNFALLEAPRHGWLDGRILAALALGGAALVAFVVIETRSAHPLMPLALFRSRRFCAAVALILCVYAGFNALMLFLPLNLIQVQGYDPVQAGLTQLPVLALLVLLSRTAGRLADRRGPRLPLTLGPALAGAGFALLAMSGLTAGPSDYWAHYLPGLAALGVGFALTMAPLSTTLLSAVSVHDPGLAAGINSTTGRLAGLLAIGVLGAVSVPIFERALIVRAAELPAETRYALQAEAVNLGNARAHDPAAAAAVRLAFVDLFRMVMLAAAALAGLGALIAAGSLGESTARTRTP